MVHIVAFDEAESAVAVRPPDGPATSGPLESASSLQIRPVLVPQIPCRWVTAPGGEIAVVSEDLSAQ